MTKWKEDTVGKKGQHDFISWNSFYNNLILLTWNSVQKISFSYKLYGNSHSRHCEFIYRLPYSINYRGLFYLEFGLYLTEFPRLAYIYCYLSNELWRYHLYMSFITFSLRRDISGETNSSEYAASIGSQIGELKLILLLFFFSVKFLFWIIKSKYQKLPKYN